MPKPQHSCKSKQIRLHVNGRDFEVIAEPSTFLIFVLRNDLGLNGPKYGCGLGQCGACTVLVNGYAARSCRVPIGSIGVRSITTLEGLATGDDLHYVQKAFIAENATQCGYCLNGMIMTVVSLLNASPRISDAEFQRALRHNLCRCGAHIEILKAANRAARDLAIAPQEVPRP